MLVLQKSIHLAWWLRQTQSWRLPRCRDLQVLQQQVPQKRPGSPWKRMWLIWSLPLLLEWVQIDQIADSRARMPIACHMPILPFQVGEIRNARPSSEMPRGCSLQILQQPHTSWSDRKPRERWLMSRSQSMSILSWLCSKRYLKWPCSQILSKSYSRSQSRWKRRSERILRISCQKCKKVTEEKR